MSCQDKSVVLELMALKKPTALDEFIDTVPKPKGAIPSFGLPRWKIMPLESKIPMIPGPEGSYHFTRNKIGKKLWVGSADARFNLNDPYNYEAEWTYDPLHDEHLARFFSQPSNIRRMIKLGLITNKLDAKCSVRDYNSYRKYLKTLYNDSINLKIKRRTLMESEERALNLAEEFAEKDVKRLKARERRIEASSRLLEKNRLEEEAKIKRRMDKQLKVEQRIKDIELKKIEDKKLRIQKAWELAEILRQKQEVATYNERQKIIKTIRQWRDSEYQRKTAKAKRKIEEMEEKRRAVEERWQLRQELQKKQMERENFLQHCSHEERVMNIKAYNAKVEKERARMQRLSEKCKMFITCYTRRHVAGQKDGTCCIKRTRQHRQLGKNESRNSCSVKPYNIQGNKREIIMVTNKKKKDKKTTKQKKKRNRNRKKKIIESAPKLQPECEEVFTALTIPPTTQEPPIPMDNCKCEKIKAEWIKSQQISNN